MHRDHKQVWQIAPHQAVFMTSAIVCGHMVSYNTIAQELGHDIWLAQLIGGVFGAVFTFIIVRIMAYYPAMTLGEIFCQAFGSFWGRLFSLPTLCYIFLGGCHLLSTLIFFWRGLDMPNTPVMVYLVLVVAICAYGAYLGLEPIARTTVPVVCNLLLIALINAFFLYGEMDAEKLLPLGCFDKEMLWQSAVYFFIFQYSLLPITFYFVPFIKDYDRVRAGKCVFGGVFLMMGYTLYSFLRSVLIEGDSVSLQPYPIVHVLRMVEWSVSINRLELIGILIIVSCSIMYLILSFFTASVFTQEVCRIKNYRRTIIPLFFLAVAAVFAIYKITDNAHSSFYMSIAIILFLLQLLFYLLVMFKGQKKNREKIDEKSRKLQEKTLAR